MKFVFAICVIFSLAASALAQMPVLQNASYDLEPEILVAEVRGTVKRSAVILPKPAYPSEARATASDGIVRVEVTLDASGAVISAKAVAGESVLFGACEAAALRTRFRRIDGVAPDYTEHGSLVYGFTLARIGWLRAGFELGITEITSSAFPVNFRHLNRLMMSEWTNEREMIARLTVLSDELRVVRRDRPILVSEQNTNSVNSSSSTKTWQIPGFPARNSSVRTEAAGLAAGLLSAIRARLGGDPQGIWAFDAGHELARLMQESRDPASRKYAAQRLTELAQSAPEGADPEKIDALRKLANVFLNFRPDDQNSEEISATLHILLRAKAN